jgi:hypothetical protein
MLGLIAYRIHPKERVDALGKKLMMAGGNSNFRQDVIDYTWLMDRFEDEVLTAEANRKEEEKRLEEAKNSAPSDRMTGAEYANRLSQSSNAVITLANAANAAANTAANSVPSGLQPYSPYKFHNGPPKVNDDDIQISVYANDDKENWSFYVRSDATDEEAIAEAEKISGKPLPNDVKDRIRDARRTGYVERFVGSQQSGHQVYYGSEKMTLSLLPDYLHSSDLTEWLFIYPIQDTEAYLYSLNKFRQTSSNLWLMTAISKANKNSTQLIRLLDAAGKTNHASPAWQTIAFHHARLLMNRIETARQKRFDDILNGGRTDVSTEIS